MSHLLPGLQKCSPDGERKSWGYIKLQIILSECPWMRVSHGNVIHQKCPNFKKVENVCHGKPLIPPSYFTENLRDSKNKVSLPKVTQLGRHVCIFTFY